MVIEALFIGLVVGFLFYELTGVSPGGVVAPGYIALSILFPERILATLILALIVWIVLFVASRYLLLYGRRTLLFAVVLGFSLTVLVDMYIMPMPSMPVDIRAIGFVIPGLIGNEMRKQGPLRTLAAIAIVTVCTYLVLILAGYAA